MSNILKMTIKRTIPNWCNYHKDLAKDNNKKCCHCNENIVYFQTGDGKILHSLCYNCYYKRLKMGKIQKLKDKEFA